MSFRNLAGACLISMGTFAHALDEIVVTAARYAQPLEEVVPSVVIITREMIEQSPSVDIAGLLRWHAGLEIGRTGGTGQQTSVFIRGTESDHTTVLINGVKINSATIGIGALEMVNTSVIERIEVVKGPRSTVYGSDAVGGVINIITSTSEDSENSASFHVMQGRYGMDEQGVRLRYGTELASGNLSFSRVDTQGFPARSTSSTDHGHDNETFDLNLQTQVGVAELALGFWQAKGNTEYDSFGSDKDHDRKNNTLRAALTVPVFDSWQSVLSISRTKDEVRQNQENSSSGRKDFALTDRLVYDWKNDFTLGDHVLVLGASLTDEEADSLSFGTSYREDTDSYSVYLHEQYVKDKHSLSTAARYTDHEDFGDAVTWNLEYGFRPLTQTRLFASIGTGFRAPSSSARFGYGGNPELREETSRSIEAGVSYDLNPLTTLSVRIFENRIEDLVAWDAEISQNKNIEKARIKGLEVALSHQSGPWGIRLEGIVQDPRNETEDTRLLRRSERSLSGALAYERERFFVQLSSLVTSQRKDFGGVDLSGYGLLDVSAGYRFPYVTLALKAENLLDKEYELASGYNQPGQSVFAELQIKLM